jgi:uncharacterized protein
MWCGTGALSAGAGFMRPTLGSRSRGGASHGGGAADNGRMDAIDLEALQNLLDAVPAPLEPLDVSMLDGYLVAVALQPKTPPPAGELGWLRWVLDAEEGRAPPPGFDAEPIRALAMRRLQALDAAIRQRQWFDPWVFEMDDEDDVQGAVYPWVAGFALGADAFPRGLMACEEAQLLEPLAGLYQFLDPEDLEDADALLEAIEGIEPAGDLEQAVELLVAHSLLLADVSRPAPAPRPAPRRPGAPARRRR